MFVSKLFTGPISDKFICEQSGFMQTLKDLLSNEYTDYAVMADDAVTDVKGFNIEKDLENIGIKHNIPLFQKVDVGCRWRM